MSEIEERGAAPAGGPPAVSDDVLADHLRRRGAHPAPRTLALTVGARIADAEPERRWRLAVRAWQPRLATLALGSTLLLVAGVLYFGGSPGRITGPSAQPVQPSQSPAVAGLTWDPTQRALTPPELLRILATHPAPGTILIVDDQILESGVSCYSADHCPLGKLANAAGVPVEAPLGGILPFLTDGSEPGSVKGPLALQVTSGPNLVFLGAMVSNGLRMSFAAHDLLTRNAMGGLFVLPAWLWQTPPAPCPSRRGTPQPMPTSELGLPAPRLQCVPTSWLTDSDATDPGRGGGVGFPVQDGAYQAFAPTHVDTTGQAIPQGGIYLVRDWAGYGEVLGRLEPLGIPDPFVPQGPTPVPSETPSGVVMSAGELVSGVQRGSLAPGAIAIASISAPDVIGALGVLGDQVEAKWAIVSSGRALRVYVARGGPTSIIGTQAFVVQDGGSIRALGSVSIGGTGGRPAEAPGDGGLWVVQGWLRLGVTEAVPCPAPQGSTMTGLLGEPLSWSGCPGAWIADSPLGASGPAGTVLTDEAPNGGLHVQDGAGDPSFQPKLGVWLVRAAVTGCPDGPACPATLMQKPPANVTWWELVGSIAGSTSSPETSAPPTPGLPTQPSSSVVFDQDSLVASVDDSSLTTGAVVVADVTMIAVALPTFPVDRGALIGFVGDLGIHWNAEAGAELPGAGRYAFRMRSDGGLDYFGPAAVAADGLPFETQTATMPAPGPHLVAVHGWVYQGPPERCVLSPSVFDPPLGIDGQALGYLCDDAWIQPTAASPEHQTTNGFELRMPSGALLLQTGALPLTRTPREGVFLLRYHPCLNGPLIDICQVAGPGQGWEYVATLSAPAPVASVPGIGPVPYSIAADDPTWDRLADPRGAATACFGASDCASYDAWYPGVTRGPDVDPSEAFPLRLAGYVMVDAAWDGSDLIVHVRARKGGYQEAVVSFPSGPVHAANVVVIDQAAGGFVVATIPIP